MFITAVCFLLLFTLALYNLLFTVVRGHNVSGCRCDCKKEKTKQNKQTNNQKTAILLWFISGGLCSYNFKTKPGNSA